MSQAELKSIPQYLRFINSITEDTVYKITKAWMIEHNAAVVDGNSRLYRDRYMYAFIMAGVHKYM